MGQEEHEEEEEDDEKETDHHDDDDDDGGGCCIGVGARARAPTHATLRRSGLREAAREVVWQVPPATSSQLEAPRCCA